MPHQPRHMSRDLFARNIALDDSYWSSAYFVSQTVSGINVSQVTALSSSVVYACVSMLAEDIAKIGWLLTRPRGDGGRDIVDDHWIVDLLREPNDWQSWFEFIEMMMVQLLLRKNAYAVIIRNNAGRPIRLIPINSDRVAIWEAPGGEIFYRVTAFGLHEHAELAGEPFLIPDSDVIHIRGFTLNGLLGSSTIVLGKEAIGLALAYEQQAARWMANGSKPSGVLQTDQKLTPDTAKRLADDWRDSNTGLQNIGRVVVLEQGLKFEKMSFDAQTMDFIKQRSFQLEDIARMFRVPLHMLQSAAGGKGSEGTVEQQAAEYLNYTLTSYLCRFGQKLDRAFGIRKMGLNLDWDFSILTRADRSTRFKSYSAAIAGGYWTPNEARLDDGKNPKPGGDKLWTPTNVAFAGSQASGNLPDGGGRPAGSPNKEEIEK